MYQDSRYASRRKNAAIYQYYTGRRLEFTMRTFCEACTYQNKMVTIVYEATTRNYVEYEDCV